MRNSRTLGFAVLATIAGCGVTEIDIGVERVIGGTTTTSTTTTSTVCALGASRSCYDGPAGTEGQGLCKAGSQTCANDGASWGACVGEVLPKPEDCATPEDEDCDGQAPACTGELQWASRFGGSGEEHGYSVAVDSAGNVLVTGTFWGTVDFGGGPLTGSGLFVAKFDASGQHVWSKRFAGIGSGIVADGAGNVFVTGYFTGVVDFGGGPLASVGGEDVFLAKFDASGQHIWSKRLGGAQDDYGVGVSVDSTGNVLVTGTFGGTVDFGGGPLVSAGGQDVFLVKLDANGQHIWSKRFGDAQDQVGQSVAVDSTGNVLVTGTFWGTVNFGGGPLASVGGQDVFLVKLDTSGQHIWSKRFGSAGYDVGGGVAVDGAGDVFATGAFAGDADFGGGPLMSAGRHDVFVVKLDASGQHIWSRGFGDAQDQVGQGVAVDSAGDVVLTGALAGEVDFGGGPLASAGGQDVFLVKLDTGGQHIWSKRFGGTQDQAGQSVAVDGAGNVLVTGSMSGSANFGAGVLTSAGQTDIFLAKFSP